VCCEEGKAQLFNFPPQFSTKMDLLCSSAPLFDAKGGENHRTRERERERERKDSFGCRKNQHFIQNPHIKKKKKALVVRGEKNNNNNTIYKILTLRRRRRRSNRSKTRKKHGK
jgi:hypothetical protein